MLCDRKSTKHDAYFDFKLQRPGDIYQTRNDAQDLIVYVSGDDVGEGVVVELGPFDQPPLFAQRDESLEQSFSDERFAPSLCVRFPAVTA